MSIKYFKFHPYIIVEIFKIALPNFLDDGLWAFSSSFINTILIATTGNIGPILFSTSNKIKNLLSSPVKGYGRALMSVTGHLFGANEFDELNEMYRYVLKVSFITTMVVMIGFVIFRDYVFGLFSITGRETEIFWIAILGTVIMLAIPFSIISSKMLDGFGKSMYSFALTLRKIVFEMLLISQLYNMTHHGNAVLIGITVTEVVFAIIYYLFLRYLFKNFNQIYENKDTVKKFDSDDGESLNILMKIKETHWGKNKVISKIPSVLGLLFMAVIVMEILILPIELNDYNLLFGVLTSLVIFIASIHLIGKFNRPTISILGLIISAAIFFVFMGSYGYAPTMLFIVMAAFIVGIKIIITNLQKNT